MENESKDHGGVLLRAEKDNRHFWMDRFIEKAKELEAERYDLLSDDLSSWRAKRPDEGTMDRFFKKGELIL